MVNKALRQRLNAILTLAGQQDWSDTSFSLTKAHVCAEFSSIVYEDVQEYELKRASRIHLFASNRYRRLIESRNTSDFLNAIVEDEFDARFFVVRSRYAITLGALLGDVLILAVRGTVFQELWDWKANVDARKYFVSLGLAAYPFDDHFGRFEDSFFHRGFFEAVVPQFPSIRDEIRKLKKDTDELRIVWTGHSLGGAMAAIGNALDGTWWAKQSLAEKLPGKSVAAYTFGMPRYCGIGGVCCFAGPHHVYKKQDLVPTLPLRKMKYTDCSREYEVTDAGMVSATERTDALGIVGHIPRLMRSIKAHAIEGYAESIAKAAGKTRP